jgi:hypothetical protein
MKIQTTRDVSGGAGHEQADDDCCGGRGAGDEAGCCGGHGGKGDKCCGHETHAEDGPGQPGGTSVREGRLVVP